MTPLKVAFLWHNHQPNYEFDGEFILPWVRFHCIKDYLNLPYSTLKYKNIKQTFNFVPSLLEQIELLADGRMIDNIMKYTYPNPTDMSLENKQYVIDNFFNCNVDNLIKVHKRYSELYNKKHLSSDNWTDQEILDLQVWYNLTWCGSDIKKNYFINRLFNKEREFNQDEKYYLLEIQLNYLKQFNDNLKLLRKSNQIEISFSPFNHPILPLLDNFQCAKDNLSNIETDVEFCYPEDALKQVDDSIDKYQEIFHDKPNGIWSSEGSLSNNILDLFIDKGFKWTASDKDILKNTKNELYHPLEIYFPRVYKNDNGEINLFFRDSVLSDKIGFSYSSIDESKAVLDFTRYIEDIRQNLIMIYNEDILYKACVYIILDGENCWEYYKNNGENFLNLLFETLSVSSKIKTVTLSESTRVAKVPFEDLTSIKAGSWIYGNFLIWAGESKNHLAWKILADTRKILDEFKNKIPNDTWDDAYYYILKAESSDWFWWYYSKHHAHNKLDFDKLFRHNLEKVYKILDLDVPNIIKKPLWSSNEVQEINKSLFQNDTMHKSN